jgi:aspartate beta-hydroxylase
VEGAQLHLQGQLGAPRDAGEPQAPRSLRVCSQHCCSCLAKQLLPTTFKIVTSLPEASSMVLGATKISVMEPGTHVLAHTGLTNARLRIHLGLSGLDGVYIRVGDSTRQWRDGRCIVFDDSFVHEVWHNGTQTRIVLIVDIWHVEMDEAARQASILASSERDELVAAYQNNRAQFGPDNWF